MADMCDWRTFLIVLLGFAARAVAHEEGLEHLGEDHAFPLAELLSGAALLLAAGSLWMSCRTRKLLDERVSDE